MQSNIKNDIFVTRNNTNYPLALLKYLENVNTTEEDILQYHQKVVKHYFTTNPNHRGLLVFHGTGTGKTMLSVSIADSMKDERKVIILSAKSLQDNFKKEVRKYMKLLKKNEQEIELALETQYNFISSNAGNMLTQLSNIGKTKDEIKFEKTLEEFMNTVKLEGSLIIIDEAQNLFNGIVNGSRNAVGLYKAIMDASDIKVVFLSATPIINDPFELVPMFNMLHGSNLLPEDYDDFYTFYVDTVNISVKNKEKFKNRIFGLVSYMGDWWRTGGIIKQNEIIKRQNFPDQFPTIVEYIPMSTQQFASYMNARDLESQIKKKKVSLKETLQKPKSDPGSSYRVASRQISNFLLPESIKIKNIDSFGYTKYIDNLTDNQLMNLDVYSPKMKKILENINKHEGLCVVYSSFVTGEGLRVFSKVLNSNGWREYNRFNPKSPNEKVFVFITGEVPSDERSEILEKFNSNDNINGGTIDLMLLSGAGAEGLDLKNVRSIHIMEPYWNYGRLEQIIARAVRYKSHEALANKEDRTVQPYIYLSDYPTNFVFKPTKTKKTPEKTTDVHLYSKSVKGKLLIDRFYATMIEASIDCSIHIKNSPLEIQRKINCVLCKPNNEQLFHPDSYMDIKLDNPCLKPETTSIMANEIQYNDTTYYYTKADDGSVNIYKFDENLGAYVELERTDQNYDNVLELIK